MNKNSRPYILCQVVQQIVPYSLSLLLFPKLTPPEHYVSTLKLHKQTTQIFTRAYFLKDKFMATGVLHMCVNIFVLCLCNLNLDKFFEDLNIFKKHVACKNSKKTNEKDLNYLRSKAYCYC